MAYCPDCGSEVAEAARFCSNCAHPLSAGASVQGTEADAAEKASPPSPVAAPSPVPLDAEGSSVQPVPPAAPNLDAVPTWLGWLAIPIALTIIGLPIYCVWAYRRGRRDGVGREPNEPSYENFGWRIAGWFAAAVFLPFIDWYVFVHLPTFCYKHGLRVGAKEGAAPQRFTSVPAVIGAATIPIVAAIAGLTLLGMAVSGGFDSGDDDSGIERTTPQSAPVVEPDPEPSFSRSQVLELTQEHVAATDRAAFLSLSAKAVRCVSATFQPDNLLWVVKCDFLAEDRTTVVGDRNYIFEDLTGEVRKP